jgi:hypothetical protein
MESCLPFDLFPGNQPPGPARHAQKIDQIAFIRQRLFSQMKKTLCPSEVSGGTPNSCYAINFCKIAGYWEDAFILEMPDF